MRRQKTRKGLLVVISGPSGVGKSTVVRALIKAHRKLQLSISCSTRPPRPGEQDGRDYHFIDDEEFAGRVKNGDFLEWAQVHGYYYGTPRQYLQEELNKDKAVVLEVDVQGAEKVKNAINARKIKCAAVFIFLIPPSVDILAFRLRKRKTEDEKVMNYRLRAAIAELQVMEKYDYIVVNDRVDSAASKIQAIINVEKERMLLN